MSVFDTNNKTYPDSVLLQREEFIEPPLHPDEEHLTHGESLEIFHDKPLTFYPLDNHEILALISVPHGLMYLETGQTSLYFGCKYFLMRSRIHGDYTHGLSAYDDHAQTYTTPFLLPPNVSQLRFGREQLELAERLPNGELSVQKLPWSNPKVEPLGKRVAQFVSKAPHFQLDFSAFSTTITDLSRFGTRVLRSV